jgi:hypothetical protein
MLIMGVLIHNDCTSGPEAEDSTIVLAGLTLMVPVAFIVAQLPSIGILYMNVPDEVGVPLMVMVLLAQVAVTPVGNPIAAPIPVAIVVVWVMGVSAVLIHKVGVLDAALTVIAVATVMVPVA